MYLDEEMVFSIREDDELIFHIWEPDSDFILLGYHNKVKQYLYFDRIVHDQLPLIRRLGGGNPFLAQPGMIIISAVKWLHTPETIRESFYYFHSIFKHCLNFKGINHIEYNKVNALSIKNRTFLTSNLHHFGNMIFFQSFLFISCNLYNNFLYLKNSYSEQLCRNNEFEYTTLKQEGYNVEIDSLINLLSYHFNNLNFER